MAVFHVVSLMAITLIGSSLARLEQVCEWSGLRAAIVRDALYVNGGFMTTIVEVNGPSPFGGNVYALNLSRSFSTSNNDFSALFTMLSGSNITAVYMDGIMFANNDELYLYGYVRLNGFTLELKKFDRGLCSVSSLESATPPGRILGYQIYQTETVENTGPLNEKLGDVPNYITSGAGVNVPSESLGFYFSGMVAPKGNELLFDDTKATTPVIATETFIQVYLSDSQGPQWSTQTWPFEVRPRAGAQLVWLPVSSQGVLIAIGGVIDPSDLTYGGEDNSSQILESSHISPTFMTSIPVYDIANRLWYTQNTTGTGPGQLSDFCSVVANANGSSTFEIFIYGGYDGLNGTSQGAVWVLSIPSFVWVQVYDPGSDATHLRDSHSCVKPYPDQMFVIGGENTNADGFCTNGIINIFNLNSLNWMDRYDPAVWSEYTIPPNVSSIVSATPYANGINPSLAGVLGTKYNGAITSYYPYSQSYIAPNSGSVPLSPRTKKWLAPVLGAVLGFVGLLIVVSAMWYFLRRRNRKSVTRAQSQKRFEKCELDPSGLPRAHGRSELEGHGEQVELTTTERSMTIANESSIATELGRGSDKEVVHELEP
jgi:Kelch motif